MMAISVYKINKGINRPIEFKGLKAQYIWYLAAVIVGLLILFAILYFLGINQFLAIGIVGIIGAGSAVKIFELSKKYGQYGLMKAMARRMLPNVIRSSDRKIFYL